MNIHCSYIRRISDFLSNMEILYSPYILTNAVSIRIRAKVKYCLDGSVSMVLDSKESNMFSFQLFSCSRTSVSVGIFNIEQKCTNS